MRRYRAANNDPHWITLKYPHTAPDGTVHPKGTPAFYVPAGKRFLFGPAADAAAARFEAERFDEEQYSAGYGV